MLGKEILNNLTAYKQGMQISEVKRKYNINKIVKLASNENLYGCPESVEKLFRNEPLEFEYYPDGYAYELRKKMADFLQVNLDQLVFGAGSDEIITLICRAFLYPGTNTVMANPTFPQYRHHALIEGAEVKEIPTVDGRHDLDRMLDAIDDDTKVVWLCTPDNPTGEIITKEQFASFMDHCPKDVLVVLDEAYYEFVDPTLTLSLHDTLENYENVIVLRTFSKIYGLASLRIGYGIAQESIAEKLNIVRGPFNTGALSQRAAIAAISDQSFVETMRAKNNEVKGKFTKFLDSIGWTYNESHTNFLLVHTPIDADDAANYLLRHGFIVRSGNLLGYPKTLRITIGKEEDMKELQTVIMKLQQEVDDGVFS